MKSAKLTMMMFAVFVCFSALFCQATEFYEDFSNAPRLSSNWMFGVTNNVALGYYTSETSTDNKTAIGDERRSLQIAELQNSEGVQLEILSPFSERPLRQVSYCIKRTGTGNPSSDAFAICGQTGTDGEWRTLAEWSSVSTSKQWLTNDIAAAENVNRVKFVFTASAGSCRNCSLDSLRVSDEVKGEPEEPTGNPTAPQNLVLKATAADTLQATWNLVAGVTGYRTRLFQVVSDEATKVSDYSGLPDAWPAGWTHYEQDRECYKDTPPKIKLQFRNSWVATEVYPDAITEVTYRFRSRIDSSNLQEDVALTYIRVETSASLEGDDWQELNNHKLASNLQTFTERLPYEKGVRRLRFSVDYRGNNDAYAFVNIEFGKVEVRYGRRVAEKLAEQEVTAAAAAFPDLEHEGIYFVEVASMVAGEIAEELTATSADLDLSREYFRPEGPLSVLAFDYGAELTYCETFNCLNGMSQATLLRKIPLRGLQFYRNGEKQVELNYTSGANATKSGCYAFSDSERSDNSYLIGSLASGVNECSFGYAITNDYKCKIRHAVISFDSVQWSFKSKESTYHFEYCVTDGDWAISRTSGWKELEIPTTAPYTADMWTSTEKYWRRGIAVKLELKSTFAPGKVLLLRWRHPKVVSGPMMGIDNVRLAFKNPIGLAVRVK